MRLKIKNEIRLLVKELVLNILGEEGDDYYCRPSAHSDVSTALRKSIDVALENPLYIKKIVDIVNRAVDSKLSSLNKDHDFLTRVVKELNKTQLK